MNNGEKRHIPGSKPEWNLELPDGDLNSLVTKDGKVWDGNEGWNYDEKDDNQKAETSYDNLGEEVKFDPEGAEERQREAAENKQSA